MKIVDRRQFIFLLLIGIFFILTFLIIRSLTIFNINKLYAFYSIFVIFYISSRFIASSLYKSYVPKNILKYKPTFSFIIPVYNEEKVIEKTIQHCLETDYPRDKFEVIIVDDGSTDNTLKIIKKYEKLYSQVKVIDQKINQGKREAMDAGIHLAKGELIVQLDSDSYAEKNAMKLVVGMFEDRKLGAVSVHTDPENRDDNHLTKMQAAYYFIAFRLQKAAESSLGKVFCCSGCCSIYRKEYIIHHLEAWKNERHLGVRTIYGDDRSLTNYLIKDGYNTAYCDHAQAYTIVPNNIRGFIKQQQRWKKGWTVGTVRIAAHIIKADPFLAFLYLFPQIVVNIMTPFLIFYSVFYVPIVYKTIPIFYILGLLCLYGFYLTFYSAFRQDKYRPYILLWACFNIILACFIFPSALLTLRDASWGTR